MEIQFCDRCDARLNPEDIQAGRCKQTDARAWCPACSREIERAAVGSVRAQVVSEPPARKAPLGVQPISRKPPSSPETGTTPESKDTMKDQG